MKNVLLLLIFFGALTSGMAQDLPTISLRSNDGRTIEAQILSRLVDGETGFRVRRGNGAEFDIEASLLTPDSLLVASQELQRQEMAIAQDFKEVLVTHKVTKFINGKYHYWFDIRNFREEAFSGKVKITLLNKMEGITNGDAVFSSPAPIDPGLGATASLESNTGPPSVHGNASVVGFLYQVIEGEKVVYELTTDISDQVR